MTGGNLSDKQGFDPEAMEKTAVYKIMAGCIVPRPIAFITTMSREGIRNAAPFSFFNCISTDPPLVCVAISPVVKTEHRKDTLANILETREFVVNIVNTDIAQAQDICSGTYPSDVDEIALAKLTALDCHRIKPPRLLESPVNFECRLVQSLVIENSRYTLVIGRVVYIHVRPDLISSQGRIDAGRLAAVGRMAGNMYTHTSELFTLAHDTFDVLTPEPRDATTSIAAREKSA
jgi:flavin reductase (DIM6/NTAB) family NADH-FMN oxidoreductase RutF